MLGHPIMETQQYLETIDLAGKGIEDFGEDQRITTLRARIVERRREWHRSETLRNALEQSREFLEANEPDLAVETLAAALARYPDEPQLAEAIAEARQAVEVKNRETGIRNACQSASSKLERQDFQPALAALDAAIQQFGDDPRLSELRERVAAAEAEHKRETAIQNALAASQRNLADGNPEGALEELVATANDYLEDERIAEYMIMLCVLHGGTLAKPVFL